MGYSLLYYVIYDTIVYSARLYYTVLTYVLDRGSCQPYNFGFGSMTGVWQEPTPKPPQSLSDAVAKIEAHVTQPV